MIKRLALILSLFIFVAVFPGQAPLAQGSGKVSNTGDSLNSSRNELTIYVIPSKVKFDWTSPHTLYKSYLKNYTRNLLSKRAYVLGHAFIELSSPLVPENILAGMRAASSAEQREMVLREHYGLAILGAEMKGELETSTALEPKLNKYSRKGRIAFMKFIISDAATERLLKFFSSFKLMIDSNSASNAYYGGAFWPRYNGEGAGCSAFAVSFLDLAGLMNDIFKEWMIRVNIPMELIGGPYNENNEVKFREIKKYNSWATNCDNDPDNCVNFGIYDPTLIFEWIGKVYDEKSVPGNLPVTPVRLNKSEGIVIDGRKVPVPVDEKIFQKRENPSIFIDYFHHKPLSGQ